MMHGRARFWMRRASARVAGAALALAGVMTLVFLLKHLVPGDPVDAMLGEAASDADREALARCLGLDQPLGMQALRFAGHVLDGTLGVSCRDGHTRVATLIAGVLPYTLALAGSAVGFALALALPLGLLAAWRPGSPWDAAARLLALAGLAIPSLWMGPLLLRWFYVDWALLPGPADPPEGIPALVLPTLTLGVHLAAVLMRMTRASLLQVSSEDFMRTAAAKGLSPSQALRRHALRPALLPVVTLAGLQLGGLLGGAIVTERIFGRPGLGTLLLDALAVRDWRVIEGVVLVIALGYVLVNLLVDLLYGVVDPRLRVEGPSP